MSYLFAGVIVDVDDAVSGIRDVRILAGRHKAIIGIKGYGAGGMVVKGWVGGRQVKAQHIVAAF